MLRRAGQTLKFVQDLEDAARAVLDRESQSGALEQALADKRRELAGAESAFQQRQREVDEDTARLEREYGARIREYEAQCDTLDRQLEEKQAAVKQAMANEDDVYQGQCAEHRARIENLLATIQEREGYLARLQERIGQLRADMELVR